MDASPHLTIAGHELVSHEHAGGLLNLRIALRGEPLVALARALAKLPGVRVTTGPGTDGRERCHVVQCQGFKMILSAPAAEAPDHAVALVSRSPQTALALLSDLGAMLEHLMSEPSPPAEATPATERPSTPLRRSGLQQGAPLARRTELKRKTPLARGRFNKL
jgi:hypothetical protein